ncbi:MAG TPA: hypothetical protein DEA43_03965 [Candidatus Moranbacteria bacterium]|nr:hypothetical protein [Candidatus Moranbacteria bacterium]HBT46010.1 hypothetical protein [Candidatus Moranbacteria bacterium]
MQDLIYEFLKISAKRACFFVLPSEEEGSGCIEVFSDSKTVTIKPLQIILQTSEENSVRSYIHLLDAGFEILHPIVLLNLLMLNQMPKEWRDMHIDFIGAWFYRPKYGLLTISVDWFMNDWVIHYDRLSDDRKNRVVATATLTN